MKYRFYQLYFGELINYGLCLLSVSNLNNKAMTRLMRTLREARVDLYREMRSVPNLFSSGLGDINGYNREMSGSLFGKGPLDKAVKMLQQKEKETKGRNKGKKSAPCVYC